MFEDSFADEHHHACCRSNAFNPDTTVALQNLFAAHFMLFIDA